MLREESRAMHCQGASHHGQEKVVQMYQAELSLRSTSPNFQG